MQKREDNAQINFTLVRITVFTTKLVQFVSYNVKPMSVSPQGPLINKLHFGFNIHNWINTAG